MNYSFNIKPFIKEKYKHLKWNEEEKIFQKRNKILKGYDVPISAAIQLKFKRSVFGIYLNSLNKRQIQSRDLNANKLDITNLEISSFTHVQARLFKEDNDISHNLYNLLVRAVKEQDCINWKFLYDHIEDMRIFDFHVTFIDPPLLKFKNLRILSLCGNWIEHINGIYLPRTLQLLECFANSISNVESLCRRPPKGLLYVGLSRNKFANDCKFEHFKYCGRFKFIKCLDLSNNDIYLLIDVLQPLIVVTSLNNLVLEGNPCAMCVAYKDAVLFYLPHLGYLDNVEILKKDREIKKFNTEQLLKGALIFTCHRIIGLPAPPKLKDVLQTIHVEVTLPLLEKSDADEKKYEHFRTKNDSCSTGNFSYYVANDEYAAEQQLHIKNTAFKTKSMIWSKIMQTPEEYLCIKSPEDNLFDLRDTFRSTVNVKVIYLMIQPPPSVKGNVIVANPQDEVILKKITLASFNCKLYDVSWSDKTIDYYWIDDPKCYPNAIPVKGSLRAINYVEDKPPVPKKGAPPTPINKVPSREYLPNVFTCQIGFGLKRLDQD